MADRMDTLQKLHTRVVDSLDGYREAKKHLGDSGHASIVDKTIANREGFFVKIGDALRAEGQNVEDDGSTAAAAHRALFKIRDVLSSGASGVLAECARGDDYLKSSYDEAIEATEGDPKWRFLQEQRREVETTIGQLKATAS